MTARPWGKREHDAVAAVVHRYRRLDDVFGGRDDLYQIAALGVLQGPPSVHPYPLARFAVLYALRRQLGEASTRNADGITWRSRRLALAKRMGYLDPQPPLAFDEEAALARLAELDVSSSRGRRYKARQRAAAQGTTTPTWAQLRPRQRPRTTLP